MHLEVSSRVENVEVVQRAVDDVLARHGVGERRRHGLVVAVGEAVANAIVHGNAGRPERFVVVDVELDADAEALTVEVGDEGAGFDPATVADPRAPDRRLRPDGRGVLLMRDAFDEMRCLSRDGGGSVVRLRAPLAASSESYS